MTRRSPMTRSPTSKTIVMQPTDFPDLADPEFAPIRAQSVCPTQLN
jgi:hypothetical protein